MAKDGSKARKPRIRATAPTVRQKIEQAQAKADDAKPASKVSLKSPKILKGRHIPNNKILSPLRNLGKALRWLAPRYLINAWRELRQVIWPNRRETWRLTLAVFIFAIVFGALVAGVDKGLDEIFKKVVLK